MKAIILAAICGLTLASASIARADIVSLSGLQIRRLVTTSDGYQFIYVDVGTLSACDKNVWGVTYGVLNISTKEMYAQVLALKSQNLPIQLVIVNTAAAATNVAWTATTTCQVNYLDQQ